MTQQKIISSQQAKLMLQRYYEGQTSNEEEKLLRLFLTSTPDPYGIYDADRAVMGLFCCERKHHQTHTNHHRLAWISGIAACIALCLYLFNFQQTPSNCIAYINGEKYTDQSIVLRAMSQTIQSATNNSVDNIIENQLSDAFNTTNNNIIGQ